MDNNVIRTRTTCPRCGGNVPTRIDSNGVHQLAHRLGTRQPQLCR